MRSVVERRNLGSGERRVVVEVVDDGGEVDIQ